MTKKKLGLIHPTIFPLPMIERIIKMASNRGDTILDPFVGSGTTLVAAAKLQRNAIGFEIDCQYQSTIVKRLELETVGSGISSFRLHGPKISRMIEVKK